ncbi:MAG: hypothetical protein ABIR06_06485, partial [Cyclobacteriaceae bacterium]
LRMAKLSYLDSSPPLVTPFFWSAFVLVGDDQPLDTRYKPLSVILMMAGAFLLLAFLVRKKLGRLTRSH